MYKILILLLLFIISLYNVVNAEDVNQLSDLNNKYDISIENNLSKKYKVQDFYGTWVAVKMRYMYPCDIYNYKPFQYNNLGRKIIIQPKLFHNTIKSNITKDEIEYKFNKFDLEQNIFYSTEIIDIPYIYYPSRIYENMYNYEALVYFRKDLPPYDLQIGSNGGFLFIKDKNTLIYNDFDFNQGIIYLLVREEEAKKLDKYTIYIPNKIIDTDEEEIIEKRFCGKMHDEIAYKLIKEGKYNIIRDKNLAHNFIDIK
jgi:hypothetical protein